jgi:cell division protein FtsB
MSSKWSAAVLTLVVAYFAYHAFAGEQGLGRWHEMQRSLADKQARLDQLVAKNTALQNDIARLMPGQVDPDLAEFLVRQQLGFVRPDELVLLQMDPTYAETHK